MYPFMAPNGDAEIVRSETHADEYILRSFGALHTVGEQYVLNDIDGFVQSRMWTAMTRVSSPEPLEWHKQVLDARPPRKTKKARVK